MQQFRFTQPSQLPEVAICHMACFPDSVSTRLGRKYVSKSLGWFLAGDNRFLFHLYDEQKVIGYCGGFCSRGIGDGSTSGMMQYAAKEAISGMLHKPWLFFNKEVAKFYPLIIKNSCKKIAGIKPGAVINSITDPQNKESSIGLVVIGIHPEHRGKGCFKILMKNFESECSRRNVFLATLSVKTLNKRAIAAYKKEGWSVSKERGAAIEMFKRLGIND